MQQPSDGIARDLLPHVHLVSTYRFPVLPSLHHDKAAEWLFSAPKIASNTAPFYWTYLDRPAIGTILLVWQSPSLGIELPSDGYIWSPGEARYQVATSGGGTLEMYHQKVGYSPGEPIATLTRRRYRLLPAQGAAQVDPSMWLIHYAQCDPNERVSSQAIPITPQIQNTMQTRQYLHQQGQIVQKEFMLHDRHNWPQIQFPRAPTRQQYAPSMPPARVPIQVAYPAQHSTAGPPPKRVRRPEPSSAVTSGSVIPEGDDEEDTSRGDFFDFTTPREISIVRYKQNHEWMEEILSSPYAIHKIVPADLGLGLSGELAPLTNAFFDAPGAKGSGIPKHTYVGRLEVEKADEFRQKAVEHVKETNKEIEKMKAKHAKRLAKFQKGSLLSTAEKNLRTAVANPSDVGPEYWRLEGRVDEEEDPDTKAVSQVSLKVDDIVAQVEASLGRHVVAIQELRRIQDGGFEEAAVAPPSPQRSVQQSLDGGTPHSSGLGVDVDMDMGNSAAGLMDQYHTGLSSNATPGSGFPTPQPHLQTHSTSGTPGIQVPSPVPNASASPQPQVPVQAEVNMTGTGEQGIVAEGTSGDWVVVPPGGVSPDQTSTSLAPSVPNAAATSISPHPTTTASNTPLPDFGTSPNAFSSLGDLDTAGEALAGYGDSGGDLGDDLGLELDMDVGMDDSAFGEAFHGVEPRELGEDNNGDGL